MMQQGPMLEFTAARYIRSGSVLTFSSMGKKTTAATISTTAPMMRCLRRSSILLTPANYDSQSMASATQKNDPKMTISVSVDVSLNADSNAAAIEAHD